MKISIIVPVYNCANYLTGCLDSLVNLRQVDGISTEIILVDDGSKDESPSICDTYGENHDNIMVFHTENKGVSSARNFGLEKATGDWILYVDGDDTLRTETLEVLVENRFWDYDVVRFGVDEVSSDASRPVKTRYSCDRMEQLKLIVSRRTVLGVWGGLYKHSLISSNSIAFDSDIRMGEDWLVLFKLMIHARSYTYVDKNLYGYTVNQQSATRRKIDYVRPDALVAYQRIQDYAKAYHYQITASDIAKAQSTLRRNMMKEAILNNSKKIFKETDRQLNLYAPQSLVTDIVHAERMKHRLGFVLYFILDKWHRIF